MLVRIAYLLACLVALELGWRFNDLVCR